MRKKNGGIAIKGYISDSADRVLFLFAFSEIFSHAHIKSV